MVHINQLRSVALCHFPEDEMTPPTPEELLQKINGFCPIAWAQEIGSGANDLQVLGRIWKSTVALYCILALDGGLRLDKSSETDAQKVAHYELLISLLKSSIQSPIQQTLIWPFCVVGVAAKGGSTADRTFISAQLSNLKKSLGQGSLMVLKTTLERYWKSDKTHWNDCFDQPYCFAG